MQQINKIAFKAPQVYLDLLNQIFEIEKKVNGLKEQNSIHRNINRMKRIMEEDLANGSPNTGLSYHNPLGEGYSDTRTDCEATISGTGVEDLEIVEVIRPIIFYSYQENNQVLKAIVQRGVVIVQSKNS